MANEENIVMSIVLSVLIGIIAVIIFQKVAIDYSANLGKINSNVSINLSGIDISQPQEDIEEISNSTQQMFNGTESSLDVLKESSISLLKIISTTPKNLITMFSNMNSLSGGMIDGNLMGYIGTILLIVLSLAIVFIIFKVFI